MMAAVRGWLTAVVAASLVIAAAQSLIPGGTLKKIASLTGGLILVVVLLQPLLKIDFDGLSLDYQDYQQEIAQRQEELEAQGDEELSALIAQKTEAYIWDKATQLGLECTVHVETEPDANGVPYPTEVTLSCPKSRELSDYLTREIGIPEERQQWNGT